VARAGIRADEVLNDLYHFSLEMGGAPSYCRWTAVELSSDNQRMLYVPEGVALPDARRCERGVLPDGVHVPPRIGGQRALERSGFRHPLADPILCARDAGYGDFVPQHVK
jgi:hypothetical protein